MSTTAFLPDFPIRASLALVKGDPYHRGLALISAAGIIDTTGWWALFQIRHPDTNAVLVEASTANGRIIVGIQGTAPNQIDLEIDIPALVTSALTDWGVGSWQLQAGPDASSATTYFGGDAWLTPDVAF